MNIDITAVEFITARIAEREANATRLRCIHSWSSAELSELEAALVNEEDELRLVAVSDQVRVYEVPDRRVLAECEAMRKVLARADLMAGDVEFDQIGWEILDHLSSVWSDHPDYNPGWRT